MQSAIKTHKISRKFGSKTAVNSVSLNIKQSEIYGFLGPNGAGKTTLLKMLVGLLSPTSGSGTMLGLNIVKDAQKVRLLFGAALQEASLDENQTGKELIKLQGQLYGLSRAQINDRLSELSRLIDIGDALDKRIKTYSGGMKRRVDLAASLIHEPKILFLDEPTTGLDPLSRNKVWQEIKHLNQELGMTIFLTTQYLEEADELADRVGIISQGAIVVEDTPKNLKQHIGSDVIEITVNKEIDRLQTAFKQLKGVLSVEVNGNTYRIGTKKATLILAPVVALISELKLEITALSVHQPTLDDVFFAVTDRAKKEAVANA